MRALHIAIYAAGACLIVSSLCELAVAQPCRRSCRADEGRDIRGCCVPGKRVRKPKRIKRTRKRARKPKRARTTPKRVRTTPKRVRTTPKRVRTTPKRIRTTPPTKRIETKRPVVAYETMSLLGTAGQRGGGGGVRLARVNKDNVPDIIAAYYHKTTRAYRGGPTRPQPIYKNYVGAFDGKTHKILWKRKATGASFLQVGAGRVLVAQKLGKRVELLDARTGSLVTRVPVNDQVSGTCANPRQPWQMYLNLMGKPDLHLDVRTGTTRQARRPAWCDRYSPCGYYSPNPRCVAATLPATLATKQNITGRYAIPTPKGRVVIGVRLRGSRYPVAVRLNDKNQVVWNRILGYDADVNRTHMAAINGNVLVHTYRSRSKGSRTAAIRLSDGKPLWDVSTTSMGFLTVSPLRTYVIQYGNATVLDTKTGKLLGKLGYSRRKIYK